MHTFSPAKMWIAGLDALQKPLLHLHTQSNRDLPWNTIDMDFMNLNEAAHGDREFGYIETRLRIPRKKGGWLLASGDETKWRRVGTCRGAMAGGAQLKFVRFGDNMRDVAVTEGDKVEAQIDSAASVSMTV